MRIERLDPQVRKKYADINLLAPLRCENSLSEIFHENTKLTAVNGPSYGARVSTIAKDAGYGKLFSEAYKTYSLMDDVALEKVEPGGELERAIFERRSERSFTGESLTLDELGRLLFFTYGRTDERTGFRAVPSAGGLYPLELYVLAFRIAGLDKGIYHYNVDAHSLDTVERGDYLQQATELLFSQGIDMENSCFVLLITGFFRRSTFKYLDRGYRMILMEVGEAGQNLSLLATRMKLGSCYVGGFLDDRLNDLLRIDGVDEAVLTPIVVGKLP